MRFFRLASAFTAICALLAGGAVAQESSAPKPTEAGSLMASAYKQAKAIKKPVLVIFGATW